VNLSQEKEYAVGILCKNLAKHRYKKVIDKGNEVWKKKSGLKKGKN